MTIAAFLTIEMSHAPARTISERGGSAMVSRASASGSVGRSCIEASCGIAASTGSSSLLLHAATIARSIKKGPPPEPAAGAMPSLPKRKGRCRPRGTGGVMPRGLLSPEDLRARKGAKDGERACKPSANGESRGRAVINGGRWNA
jgi:hypothetical protein